MTNEEPVTKENLIERMRSLAPLVGAVGLIAEKEGHRTYAAIFTVVQQFLDDLNFLVATDKPGAAPRAVPPQTSDRHRHKWTAAGACEVAGCDARPRPRKGQQTTIPGAK